MEIKPGEERREGINQRRKEVRGGNLSCQGYNRERPHEKESYFTYFLPLKEVKRAGDVQDPFYCSKAQNNQRRLGERVVSCGRFGEKRRK